MERDEILDALTALGVVKAEFEYHGGGDEGFLDEYTLVDATGENMTLPEDLEYEIEDFIMDAIGNGNGPDIAGTMTFHVSERWIVNSYDVDEPVHYDEEI
jgi:hypothetical protein